MSAISSKLGIAAYIDSNTFATESARATNTVNVVLTVAVGRSGEMDGYIKVGHVRRKVVIDH